MARSNTRQRLSQMTNPGEFEELATAVLRERDRYCRRLAQVGTNVEGKTVQSRVDGIVYVSIDGRHHMLAVHHTTCRRQDLRRKWLTGPDSDLKKTLRGLEAQRQKTPGLEATLILTTNKEPATALLDDVDTAGRDAGIEVKVWPGSALAHALDTDPRGQWIRQEFFGVEPTALSGKLLHDLSLRSIRASLPPDDPELWVHRTAEDALGAPVNDDVQFVLGESGVGKTVACLRHLQRHVQAGGFGLVVNDETLRTSVAIEDTICRTLQNLQPSLGDSAGSDALSLASENDRLILVIEDINRSPQPSRLVERLAAWNAHETPTEDVPHWRILCPIWPRTIALVSDNASKAVNESTVLIALFTKDEAMAAVRRRCDGLTDLEAEALASDLGYDPLLIALHEGRGVASDPASVIHGYVTRSLNRLAASVGRYTDGEYWGALRTLSLEMLKRRRLEPCFAVVSEWTAEKPEVAMMMRELAGHREVIRLEGTGTNQRAVFRHDRVRNYVLADAIAHTISHDDLPVPVTSEPYFAEILGTAVTRADVSLQTLKKVMHANPLALFCALRSCSRQDTDRARWVLEAATSWAHGDACRDPLNRSLRTAVLRVLSVCDGAHVRRLCATIEDKKPNDWSLRGRFRNGDVLAGVQLCAMVPPGVRWAGHVELIDFVAHKGGSGFIRRLENVLRRTDLSESGRSGALRLAGFVGNSDLAGVLGESWSQETAPLALLPDYLWACSQCCGDEPAPLLEPLVDTWATVSDEDKGAGSPRANVGANELRFAFRDKVPQPAIGYFLERAESPELCWPIQMMLHGIDHPGAVEFVVRQLAQQDAQSEVAEHSSPFADTAVYEWSERKRYGIRPMSTESRTRLLQLWSCDSNSRNLRRRALRFWCATVAEGDIQILRRIDIDSDLGNLALGERLRRGDRKAVPGLVSRLQVDDWGYWWQACRYVWTDELTDCLDRALARRADELTDSENDATRVLDRVLVERLLELPLNTCERLLVQHWAGLSRSAYYVKAALYVASPGLLQNVAKVVAERKNTEALLEYLSHRWRLGYSGRRGLTSLSQVNGLLPYLDCLSDADITMLWRECNKKGWFEWRRRHLDVHAQRIGIRFVDDAGATMELDRRLGSKGPVPRLYGWGESFLESGVSLEHMMDVVSLWVARRPQKQVLREAAHLVTGFGKRRHLAVLNGHAAAKSRFGQEVIRNADFDLRLRSLD